MNYAFLYYYMGRYPEAESMLVDVVKKRRRLFPGELQALMVSLSSLTGVYSAEGKLADAEPIALESLELSRRLHGDDHPDTLNCLHDVARIYRWRGDYENAEKLLSEQLERSRRVLGPEHKQRVLRAAFRRLVQGVGENWAEIRILRISVLLLQGACTGPVSFARDMLGDPISMFG